MNPAQRVLLTLLSVAIVLVFLSTLTTAGIVQLYNDNGDFYAGSHLGRFSGDIDGAVFTPSEDLFPITMQSVQFGFHRSPRAPWITDSAQVRVLIYAMHDGVPGDILAESEPRTFFAQDEWVSIPLPRPVTIDEPASFMAAVKWESGTEEEPALPLALDSNLEAPQSEKDEKNLYHRVDLHMPEACQSGFCTHSELGLADANEQSMGFNMIRVTLDTPLVTPTHTPTKPTRTPTPTATATVPPHPAPGKTNIYLPAVFRDHDASVQVLRIGKSSGEAISYALTSGATMDGHCWPGDENNLWVGRESEAERGTMRSVISFDLSDVPSDAILLDAKLTLFAVEASSDPEPLPLFVSNVTRPWPACPTWNTLADAMGATWASTFIGPAVSVYTLDVTPLVGNWLSRKLPNHGLMLRSVEDVGEFRGFVSTASAQEDLRPRLVIRYRRP